MSLQPGPTIKDDKTNSLRLFLPPVVFDNGMQLTIARTLENTPYVNKIGVAVAIKHGSTDDYGKGTAHLLEHMLFHGGGDMTGNKGIWYVAERAGVLMNAMTWTDGTMYYYIGEAADVYDMMSWLVKHITNPQFATGDPNFDAVGLATERVVVVNEEEIGNTRLLGTMREELMSLMFNHTEYGRAISGNRFEVLGTRVEDLKRFYDTYYRPSEMHMFVIGDIAESYLDGIVNHCRQTFGIWDPVLYTPYPMPRNLKIQPVQTGVRRSIIRSRGVYAAVSLGFSLPSATSESMLAMACFDKLFMHRTQGSPICADLAKLGAIDMACNIEALKNASTLTFTVLVPASKLFTSSIIEVVSTATNTVDFDTPSPAAPPVNVSENMTPEELALFGEHKSERVARTTPLLRKIERTILEHLEEFASDPFAYLTKHATIVSIIAAIDRNPVLGTSTVPLNPSQKVPINVLVDSQIVSLALDPGVFKASTPDTRNKSVMTNYVDSLVKLRNDELRATLESPMRLVETLGFSWINGDMLSGLRMFGAPSAAPVDPIFGGKPLSSIEQMKIVVATYCKRDSMSVVNMIPEDINGKVTKLVSPVAVAVDQRDPVTKTTISSAIITPANRAGLSDNRMFAKMIPGSSTSSVHPWMVGTSGNPNMPLSYGIRECRSNTLSMIITVPGFMASLGPEQINNDETLFISKFLEAMFNNSTPLEKLSPEIAALRSKITILKAMSRVETSYAISLTGELKIVCVIRDIGTLPVGATVAPAPAPAPVSGSAPQIMTPETAMTNASAIVASEFDAAMTVVCTAKDLSTFITSFIVALHDAVTMTPESRATAIANQVLAPLAPATQNYRTLNGYIASSKNFARIIKTLGHFNHELVNTIRQGVSWEKTTVAIACPPQLGGIAFEKIYKGLLQSFSNTVATLHRNAAATTVQVQTQTQTMSPSGPANTPVQMLNMSAVAALISTVCTVSAIPGRDIDNNGTERSLDHILLNLPATAPPVETHEEYEARLCAETELDAYTAAREHLEYIGGDDAGNVQLEDGTISGGKWTFRPKYISIIPAKPSDPRNPRSCYLFIDRQTEYTPASFVVVAKRLRNISVDMASNDAIEFQLAADIGSGFSGRVNTVVRHDRGNSYTVRNAFKFIRRDNTKAGGTGEGFLISTATCNPLNVPKTIKAILAAWFFLARMGPESTAHANTMTLEALLQTAISTTTDYIVVYQIAVAANIANKNGETVSYDEEAKLVLKILSPFRAAEFAGIAAEFSANKISAINKFIKAELGVDKLDVRKYVRSFIIRFTSEIGRAKFRRIKELLTAEYGTANVVGELDAAMQHATPTITPPLVSEYTFRKIVAFYTADETRVANKCRILYDAHRYNDPTGRTSVVVSTSYPSASRDIQHTSQNNDLATADANFQRECIESAQYIHTPQDNKTIINDLKAHDHYMFST